MAELRRRIETTLQRRKAILALYKLTNIPEGFDSIHPGTTIQKLGFMNFHALASQITTGEHKIDRGDIQAIIEFLSGKDGAIKALMNQDSILSVLVAVNVMMIDAPPQITSGDVSDEM